MNFDPYHTWLGIAPSEQPASLYRLLGIAEFESNREVITNAADRQMRHVHSMNIGPYAALSQKLLGEISQARVKLLDPEQKARYDLQLQQAKQAAAAMSAATNPLTSTGTRRLLADDPQQQPQSTTSKKETVTTIKRAHRRRNPVFELARIVIGGIVGLGIGALILSYLGKSPMEWTKNLGGGGQQQTAQRPINPPSSVQPPPTNRGSRKAEPPKPPVSPTDESSKKAAKKVETSDSPTAASDNAPAPVKPPPPTVSSLQPSPPVKPQNPGKLTVEPAKGSVTPSRAEVDKNDSSDRSRKTVPAADQLAAARAAIRELYGDRYQVGLAKTGMERYDALVELISELDSVHEEEQDPATAYGLLEMIGDVGVSAGATKQALESVDKLNSVFVVDRDAHYLELLKKLAETLSKEDVGTQPHSQHALAAAEAIVSLAERSDEEGKFERAAESWKLLASRRGSLAFEGMSAMAIEQRVKKSTVRIQASAELTEKLRELEANPADAQLNLIVGTLYSLKLEQWRLGAPYLAKSDQEKAKLVGEMELANPETAADREALGDAWSEWSMMLTDDDRLQAEFRSTEWYRLALRQVSGLAKVKLQRKLEALTKNPVTTPDTTASSDPKRKPPSGNDEPLEGDEVSLVVDLTQPFVTKTLPMPPVANPKDLLIQVLDIESPEEAKVRGGKTAFDIKSKIFIDFQQANNVWLEVSVEPRNREIRFTLATKCRYQNRGLEYPFTFETLDFAEKNSDSSLQKAKRDVDRHRTSIDDYKRQLNDRTNNTQRKLNLSAKITEHTRMKAKADLELLEWQAIRAGLPKAQQYSQAIHSKVHVHLLVKTAKN